MQQTKTKKRYFISIIHGYFKSLKNFTPSENYHLHTMKVVKEIGYTPIIIVRGGIEYLKSDPNFDTDILVYDYKNIINFIGLLFKYSFFQKNIFYVNSHEKISYLSLILTKIFSFWQSKNIFMAHTQPKRQTEFKNKIQDFVFKFVDRIRLNNVTEKEFLLKRKVKESKLFVVPLVVEDRVFKKIKNTEDRKDLLYFGQLTNVKNITIILSALNIIRKYSKYKDIKLHVVGPKRDYDIEVGVQKFSLQNNVIIYGFMSQDEFLNNFINNRLIYLNSSTTEGQCTAVFETALAGCILCLPNIMSFKDVFKEYALFHDVYDYEKLAENIMYILDHKNEFQSKVDNCIKFIKENYNKEIIETKMKTLFTF